MAVLKLFRNSTLFTTRAAAIAGLKERGETLGDGELCIASYNVTEGQTTVTKTIFGIKRNNGFTIFDKDEPIPAAQISVADASEVFTGTDVESVLSELNTKIESSTSNIKSYKVAEVATPSSENLKEYKLQVAVGTGSYTDVTDSATIAIPKDQSLIEVYLGTSYDTVDASTGAVTKYVYQLKTDTTTHITQEQYDALTEADKSLYEPIPEQYLDLVYLQANGTYTIVKFDVSKMLVEAEFGDGLIVSPSGVVSVDPIWNCGEY